MSPSLTRCDWCLGDPLMVAYHDEEWGVPLHDDRRHFEFLVLDGAQAGLSWQTILHKRDNYHRAFAGFDPAKVARFGDAELERLLADPGIVRNRQKIRSAIANAAVFLELQREHGSFDDYVWGLVGGAPRINRWRRLSELPAETEISRAMSRDLKRRGMSFVGPTICYAYMQAAGMVNDHLVGCFRHRELAAGEDEREGGGEGEEERSGGGGERQGEGEGEGRYHYRSRAEQFPQ